MKGRPRKKPAHAFVKQTVKISERVSELFKAACEKRPEIPYEFGMHSFVLEEEASAIREVYNELHLEELVALELGEELDIVDKVVRGEIWPYSGGKLKRTPVNGPHPENCFTSNHVRFVRGLTTLAVEYLTEEELLIYCNMIAIEVKSAKKVRSTVEVRNDPERYKRLRKVLLLTAQGISTEEAAKSV